MCTILPLVYGESLRMGVRFFLFHTLVLYTNHLPKVGANDDGIWRKLILLPFNAKIAEKSDIKNYANYLE